MKTRERITTRRLAIISIQILIIILAISGILFVVGILRGTFLPVATYHRVTFRITASGGNARMAYTQENGQLSESEVVTTPWVKTIIFETGTDVYLVAGNPNKMGDLSCEILLDGKHWRKETVTYPQDKVACAGYVGTYIGE